MIEYELLQKLYSIDTFAGYSDDEIKEMSEGFDEVPVALIEFWKKCGKSEELYKGTNDYWINLEFHRNSKWVNEDSKDYYYLLDENQHCYQMAIRREDMSLSDPPVYVVEPLQGGEVREVGQAEESISKFLMGMFLYEAALCAGPFSYFNEDFIWYEEDDIQNLETLLTKQPYHIYNWYSDRIDIYTLHDDAVLYIMMADEPQGTYSAKSEAALQRMNELIGDIGES